MQLVGKYDVQQEGEDCEITGGYFDIGMYQDVKGNIY